MKRIVSCKGKTKAKLLRPFFLYIFSNFFSSHYNYPFEYLCPMKDNHLNIFAPNFFLRCLAFNNGLKNQAIK